MLQQLKLADVIAKWQMELLLQDGGWLMLLPVGRWYCLCDTHEIQGKSRELLGLAY